MLFLFPKILNPFLKIWCKNRNWLHNMFDLKHGVLDELSKPKQDKLVILFVFYHPSSFQYYNTPAARLR